MKTCTVCGLTVENNTTECPNCGSFTFSKTEINNILKDVKIKLRRFK